MKTTTPYLLAALVAPAASFSQMGGDIRFQYWTSPTSAAQSQWTPPSTPSIVYHDGVTMGGISGQPLGNSITLTGGFIEANWPNLIGRPTALSAFSDDVGFASSSSLTSGLAGKENSISSGTSAQYYRGDKTWAAFPTNLSSFTNGPGYITGINSGNVITALGYTPLSSEVDGSVSNEIELPSMSGQSGKLLSNNGSAATWIAAPSARSFSYPSRTLNSAFQPSSTRDVLASYSVDISTSATLVGGQTGTVFLEIADDSGFTTNVQELARFVNGNSVSLAIAITVNQSVTGTLTGVVPAGKYARIRTSNTVGSPSFTYRSAQETLL